MPAISASAPGKSILFGEHAVVYNRPAIAVPVTQVRAKAVIQANPKGDTDKIFVDAPDIQLKCELGSLPVDHPLAMAITSVQHALNIDFLPSFNIRVTSTIPIAAGLGSGAAVSVAIIRALSTFLGYPLPPNKVSELAYKIEKKHHGKPSGIDNSVVTFAQPIYFIRGKPFEVIRVAPEGIILVIGDSGIKSSTSEVVNDLNQQWREHPGYFNSKFDTIGNIAKKARKIIEDGEICGLGPLMNENHHILQQLGVSNKNLDLLVTTALKAGAEGAKLSGAGRGGNIIALATLETAKEISNALCQAGAVSTFISQIKPPASENLGDFGLK
jgi:mevalonate kinase